MVRRDDTPPLFFSFPSCWIGHLRPGENWARWDPQSRLPRWEGVCEEVVRSLGALGKPMMRVGGTLGREGCESGVQASGLREFTDTDPWVLGKLRGSAFWISEGEHSRGLGGIGGKGFKLVGLRFNCGQRALFAGVQVPSGSRGTLLTGSDLTVGDGI